MSVRKLLGKTNLALWDYAKPFHCRHCDEDVWVTYDAILDAADKVIEDARRLAAKAVSPKRKRKKRA